MPKKHLQEEQPLLPNAFDIFCLLTIARGLRNLDREKVAETFKYLEEEGGEASIVEEIRSLKEEFPTISPDFDYYGFKRQVLDGWNEDSKLSGLADDLDKVNRDLRRAEEAFAMRYPPEKILDEFSQEMENLFQKKTEYGS
jgi:hypothetical protein